MSSAIDPPALSPFAYEDIVRRALEEDLGSRGDLTSEATLPSKLEIEGVVVARQPGRICGLEIACSVFHRLDPSLHAVAVATDGDDVTAGRALLRLRGRARSILAAERTALNFLAHLSGIATATRDLAARIARYDARLVCTRKTTPGLRALEKYAVRVGGGRNHRQGLFDAVLIKDNHLLAVGSLVEAVRRARAAVGHTVMIEVEVDTLAELDEALAADVDAVLLDNMSPRELRQAVDRCAGRVLTEASGGITAGNIEEVAATGVDLISAGWITHSAPALDVSFEVSAEPAASRPSQRAESTPSDRLRLGESRARSDR